MQPVEGNRKGEGHRALTEASMPFVAVMLEGIMLGFLYRNATTGPFIPAGSTILSTECGFKP